MAKFEIAMMNILVKGWGLKFSVVEDGSLV
jgi:hypothetical protein